MESISNSNRISFDEFKKQFDSVISAKLIEEADDDKRPRMKMAE